MAKENELCRGSNLGVKILGYALCLYHLSYFIYYSIELKIEEKSGIAIDGSLNAQLNIIHLALLSSTIIFVITIHGKKLGSKIFTAIACLFALSTYCWWYFEKYSFLEGYGLSPDSAQYQVFLKETGIFRGAGEIESVAVFVIIFLAFYSTFSIINYLLDKKRFNV